MGRDPKMEAGGLNLYGFCFNNPKNRWDYLGMTPNFTAPTDHGDTGDNRQIEYADEGGVWRLTWNCNGGTEWYASETVFVLNAVTVTPGANDENVAPPIDPFGLVAGTGDDDFAPNSVSPVPNANDTILGRVNRFIASVGGDTVTNALNSSAPVATASLQGAAAFVDGAVNVIPFVNFTPLQSAGLYDPSQNGLAISQSVGGVTRDAALFLFGAASWRALPVLGGGNLSMQASLGLSAAGLTPLGVATSGTGTASLMSSFLFVNGGRVSTATGLIQHFDPDD